MNVDLDNLFERIARKHGVPKYKVEMVYKTMFEFVKETMNSKNLNNILLPRFGKFVISKNKLLKHDKSRFLEKFPDDIGRLEKFNNKESSRRGTSDQAT
jgi:nucleoid DNA-binding protein